MIASKPQRSVRWRLSGRHRPQRVAAQPASGSKSWRWFRYPFLAEGNDPAKRQDVRRFLASRRYRIAAVTMTYWDYEWNDAYARCRTTGDEASLARLEDAYLDAVKSGIDHWRRLSWAAHGRDIPYVLLTHSAR